MQSDTTRDRDANLDLCFEKLLQEIKDKVYFKEEPSEKQTQKWAAIAKSQKEKRLADKKRQLEKRRTRLKHFD